jgi:hypothetical protein
MAGHPGSGKAQQIGKCGLNRNAVGGERESPKAGGFAELGLCIDKDELSHETEIAIILGWHPFGFPRPASKEPIRR